MTILALVLATAYAGAAVYLADRATTAERHLPDGGPADLGLAYESVAFASAVDRVPLRGWYVPSQGRRAIVLVHGINSQRWDPYARVGEKVRRYVEGGFDVLVFDLRAHGASGGDRVGLGWLERRDVQGAVDFVEQRGIAPGRIGLHGHSFGGATALLAAAAIPDVGAVVTDSAFADARPLLDGEIRRATGAPPVFTPGVGIAASLLYGVDFDTIPPEKALAQIAPRPILFIHGDADTRIPVAHAYRLKAASRNPADELWIVPGADHVQAFAEQPEAYAAKMLAFFEAHLRA